MTCKVDHLLTLVAVAVFTALSPVEAGEKDAAVRKLVILHTNDMHGHLTAWKGWEGDLRGKTIGGLG